MCAKFGTFEHGLADRYRFDGVLGRGAMGVVYRAFDLRLGRDVAIKMLRPVLTTEIGVKRFQSEIRITAAMHHPCITVIYDCGMVDDHLYYVMECLGGESLRARLDRDAQLSLGETVAIATDVAAGLQYAHEHNVIHRDIKPENIVLNASRACIVDFGLARIVNDAGSERLTESGLTVGTPQYLSPEQALAERQLGPGVDQYALACVVFEMLAGEPPFTAATATATAMRHVRDQPPRLDTRRVDCPRGLADAVDRALSKDALDRFRTVGDFIAAMSVSLRGKHGAHDEPPRSSRRTLLDILRSHWPATTIALLSTTRGVQ